MENSFQPSLVAQTYFRFITNSNKIVGVRSTPQRFLIQVWWTLSCPFQLYVFRCNVRMLTSETRTRFQTKKNLNSNFDKKNRCPFKASVRLMLL